MEILGVRNLSFCYPEQERLALRALSFSLEAGEFVVLCGPSGCGKSTLLRHCKPALAPQGDKRGDLFFQGTPLETLDLRTQSTKIGFVQQSPEGQIVTDKVWHELAFGLESLGLPGAVIRARVAEMASFFELQSCFHKSISALSGGQKQLLNLASVLILQPELLILDEPTSQLDPIAASDFLATLGKINRELGTTILLTEHRLEEVFPLCDRVLVLDKGALLAEGTPREIGAVLRGEEHAMFLAMPSAMRVWAAVGGGGASCPITVREGRGWLTCYAQTHPLHLPERPALPDDLGKTVIELRELCFRYEKTSEPVVRGLSLVVPQGDFLALLGGNGTGKTTTLLLIAGLRQAERGERHVEGRVVLLPQNPQTLFMRNSLYEEYWTLLCDLPLTPDEREVRLHRVLQLCRLEDLSERHPYDLSGGEQQRAALGKLLLQEPDILLLDEPTKGMDAAFKQSFAGILRSLQARGVTIVMVSHDLAFCAQCARRCALVFDGAIVTEGTPRALFAGNSFYTTAANRMARTLLPDAVTDEEIILACGGQLPPESLATEKTAVPRSAPTRRAVTASLPRPRKLLALLAGLTALFAFLHAIRITDLRALLREENLRGGMQAMPWSTWVLLGALLLFALAVGRRAMPQRAPLLERPERRRLSKRSLLLSLLPLLLIPAILFIGIYYLEGRKYYFITLLVLLACMLPFFLRFEGRKPGARELVLLAVLCALGVAGRAAFFMLPQCKPVLALVILSGVAFGGETGFLVGAMTMLSSNIFFAQGPWTPWQMFAMGLCGLLAGLLFGRGRLRQSRVLLCTFGALCAVLVYGGIMNPAAALIWADTLHWEILLAYALTGFPMDLVHAVATALFLWFGAEPILEKFERLKLKYKIDL